MTAANEANGWYGGTLLGDQDESSEIYRHYAELIQGPAMEPFEHDSENEKYYTELLLKGSVDAMDDAAIEAEMESAFKVYDQIGTDLGIFPKSCKALAADPSQLTRWLVGEDKLPNEQARLAALAAAQVHQQNIDNPGRTTNPDDEDLGDDELVNPRRTDEIPFDDDDDDDLDGAGVTGAIIPPPLTLGAKFNITSTMIQLLQLKRLFGGLAGDDLNMHLINFISTCKSFDIPGVGQNAIRLRLFPLSLSEEATPWLNGLTPDSITNWRQLKDAFL
ncbi:Phosphoinositide phosphatase SAC1 [Capsicum baccatum]|uniref:Phosphoinositide phosphatase SAC1 n=1 Tax=Capsicum baccatum TaxID=33114 RepID=A0A2G2WZN4_CAPBA|nr:Phosphoinositide phosphatase SAC1 [Capsicum baccatum]